MKVYKCITACTWKGRYWAEDALTEPTDDIPPEHFVPVTDVDELQAVLDTIDEEEEPETFAELSQQIAEQGFTGTGILAGSDLQLKTSQQLKELAKELGVYNGSLKTKESLIEAIESVQ